MRFAALIAALAFATGAFAEAPGSSPRPEPRPEGDTIVLASAADVTATAPVNSLRPLRRPKLAAVRVTPDAAPEVPAASPAAAPTGFQDPISAFVQSLSGVRPAAAATAPIPGASALAVARSLRPETRPTGDALIQLVSVPTAPQAASRAGSVCGVAEIKGQAIGPVPGRGACGIDQAVRVTSVSGVKLSQQPTIDCITAKALNAWVRQGVIPAVGRKGGGLAQINVIAHYSCRSRNNRAGAKLSEHSFGHAVDVGGIVLKDGTKLSVLNDWRSSNGIIKAMHRSACGPFGTVLGPGSDGYHKDHIHIDTARYRSGSYCR